MQGYSGLACTNCADDWGNSRTFHCKACLHSPAINTFLIFLAYMASFAVCCWMIRSSLATAHVVGTEEVSEFEEVSDMMKVTQLTPTVEPECRACSSVCCPALFKSFVLCRSW